MGADFPHHPRDEDGHQLSLPHSLHLYTPGLTKSCGVILMQLLQNLNVILNRLPSMVGAGVILPCSGGPVFQSVISRPRVKAWYYGDVHVTPSGFSYTRLQRSPRGYFTGIGTGTPSRSTRHSPPRYDILATSIIIQMTVFVKGSAKIFPLRR